MPRTNVLKVGLATGAAIAGVILAITSVAAHSTQASTLHQSKSVVGSLLEAANSASLPFVAPDPALSGVRDSVELEAENDAAELLAAQQKAAAELAAEQAAAAAKAALEAAEQTATPPACVATDQPEDVTEKAEASEAAEPATEAADQTEDATEKTNDQAEDKTEVPCNNGDGQDKVKVDNESKSGSDHEHSH